MTTLIPLLTDSISLFHTEVRMLMNITDKEQPCNIPLVTVSHLPILPHILNPLLRWEYIPRAALRVPACIPCASAAASDTAWGTKS